MSGRKLREERGTDEIIRGSTVDKHIKALVSQVREGNREDER